eukprot:TRINITY_DN8236_c2_g2_i1.p3 TRINITY_DN8236_c2_g2~~TRINITY_DN8236_c2_g2_i1.p3  ORF type:complete len:225 (-),score=-6.69 TRINITY_DN8236_c2_g2_i1:37-711(-)
MVQKNHSAAKQFNRLFASLLNIQKIIQNLITQVCLTVQDPPCMLEQIIFRLKSPYIYLKTIQIRKERNCFPKIDKFWLQCGLGCVDKYGKWTLIPLLYFKSFDIFFCVIFQYQVYWFFVLAIFEWIFFQINVFQGILNIFCFVDFWGGAWDPWFRMCKLFCCIKKHGFFRGICVELCRFFGGEQCVQVGREQGVMILGNRGDEGVRVIAVKNSMCEMAEITILQ